MKQFIKICLGIITLFILCIGIDLISIYTRNKPIFAVTDNSDSANVVYKGLLYDTYNCIQYSVPQIKAKWSKFVCPKISFNLEVTTTFEIIDETKVCSEALEKFFEDENYEYYFPCIKNATTFLNFGKFFNGDDAIFTVKDALEKKMVTIKLLEEKGLEFIKQPKVEIN